jgi:hypothetical protein
MSKPTGCWSSCPLCAVLLRSAANSLQVASLFCGGVPAGPQIAAPQPRGFARGLTLKPHQLEALNVMKGAEERPLGFNSVVWREVTLSGRSWWVSLLTGKISSSKPPKQATGGILGESVARALAGRALPPPAQVKYDKQAEGPAYTGRDAACGSISAWLQATWVLFRQPLTPHLAPLSYIVSTSATCCSVYAAAAHARTQQLRTWVWVRHCVVWP